MVIHVVVALVKLISLWYLKNKLIISESMYETDICSIFSTERYRVSVFHQLNIPKYAREKAPNKCLSYNGFVKLDNTLNIFATIEYLMGLRTCIDTHVTARKN